MGTFGRSFLVLDDIRPLRMLSRSGGPLAGLHVLPMIDVPQVEFAQQPGAIFPSDYLYQGENRPFGARIRYWVPEALDSREVEEDAEVSIEVLARGEVIRRLSGPASPGINQVEWGMDRAGVG